MLINEVLQLILYLGFFSAIIATVIYGINRAYETVNTISYKKANVEKIKAFDSYLAFLHYHMERSYDIVHKDQILLYSIEGIKLEEQKLELAAKHFIRITLDFIGPIMKQELIDLYGDEETLLLNISEFFSTKYEDDAIRDESIQGIMGNNDNSISDDVQKLLRN